MTTPASPTTTTDEQTELVCLDHHYGDCAGPIEYRPAMSPTGRRFPRCERHFRARLKTQRRISRTYGGPMYYGN